MDIFRPALEDLPDTFPVFPLPGALLLPGGKLPLNIFEPRYLAMIEDSFAQDRLFGMIQPDPSRPSGEYGPALYRIGCLGRLSSFSETEDGRYLITLNGVARFTVVEEVEMARGYRKVIGAFGGYRNDLAWSSGEGGLSRVAGFDRSALLGALRAYFTRRGFDANWDAIHDMSDDSLVMTLAMVCPFEPAAKQALLEASTPADRANTLRTLLEIDAHGSRGDDDDDVSRGSRRSS